MQAGRRACRPEHMMPSAPRGRRQTEAPSRGTCRLRLSCTPPMAKGLQQIPSHHRRPACRARTVSQRLTARLWRRQAPQTATRRPWSRLLQQRHHRSPTSCRARKTNQLLTASLWKHHAPQTATRMPSSRRRKVLPATVAQSSMRAVMRSCSCSTALVRGVGGGVPGRTSSNARL